MTTSSEDLIASGSVEENEPKVSEGLICLLCLKVFRSPRRLLCLHSFCQDCLQSYISSTISIEDSVTEFFCSVCKTEVRETETKSTDKWGYLFLHNTILLSALLQSKVKVDLVCDVCQAENVTHPAEKLCLVCEEALCRDCCKVHKKNSRLSKTHMILNIEELPHKQNIVLQHNSVFNCMKHAHNLLELYCKTHEPHLCAKCFITDHADCNEVVCISNETPNLSETLTQIKKQAKILADKIEKMAEMSLSNLNKLASQINDCTLEIRTLKKSIVGVLDDLEKRIKMEGETILGKERKRIEQINQECQSQTTAIKNSNLVLEKVTKFATNCQLSLLAKKTSSQLSMSKAQIEEKYSKAETFTLQLEINSQIKSLTTIPRGEMAKLKMTRNRESQILSDGFKPMKECKAEVVDVKEIKGSGDKVPWYSDVIYLSGNQLMLADCSNKMCYLLDSSFNPLSSYRLSEFPWQLSSAMDSEVAVSISAQKTIVLFLVKENKITSTKKIRTRHICYGVAVINQKKMIVSGPCNDGKKLYWSLVSLEGKETSFHEFDGEGTGQTYVTLNVLKTRLYISAFWNDSLLCFDLDGRTYFTFKHRNLKLTYSVALDRDDNVYVAGSGSHNIFQLSPDGTLIQIIISGMENMPMGVCFNRKGDTYAVTHVRDTSVSVYRLVRKDG